MDTFGTFARHVNRFVANPAGDFRRFHYRRGMEYGTTIVTFLIVFVLNNVRARDITAMNAKLDSNIMALNDADNRLVDIEMKPESVAKALFDELQSSRHSPSGGA